MSYFFSMTRLVNRMMDEHLLTVEGQLLLGGSRRIIDFSIRATRVEIRRLAQQDKQHIMQGLQAASIRLFQLLVLRPQFLFNSPFMISDYTVLFISAIQ